MDREQVDGWLAGVDDLLAGRRDDESVSGDAMRWAPDQPTMTLLPHVSDAVQLRLRIEPAAYVEALQRVVEAYRQSAERIAPAAGQLLRGFVIFDETHSFADNNPVEHYRRALEARRNRDTGPPRPPLGRWVR